MGTSTDADLYFGIQLGEHDEEVMPWLEDDSEWSAYYADKMGLKYPEKDVTKEQRNEYFRDKAKLINECPCEVSSHCSCDYPLYFICIKESHKQASRGYPEEINPADLTIKEEWFLQLKEFCEIMGIKYEEPKWWLSSMWC